MSDNEDPALTEDLSEMFARNDARAMPGTGKWKPSAHTAAVKSVMDACAKLPGWKRIRKRQVGRFIIADENGRPRKKPGGGYVTIQVSIKGDPDCELLWAPPGANRPYFIALEIKTGTGRLSPEQAEKKQHLEEGGCFYIVTSGGGDAFQKIMAMPRR